MNSEWLQLWRDGGALSLRAHRSQMEMYPHVWVMNSDGCYCASCSRGCRLPPERALSAAAPRAKLRRTHALLPRRRGEDRAGSFAFRLHVTTVSGVSVWICVLFVFQAFEHIPVAARRFASRRRTPSCPTWPTWWRCTRRTPTRATASPGWTWCAATSTRPSPTSPSAWSPIWPRLVQGYNVIRFFQSKSTLTYLDFQSKVNITF